MAITAEDVHASFYDPASNDYDLAKDPRCLYGWGPSTKQGCIHSRFGHGCCRAFGHRGRCWDGGDLPSQSARCSQTQRPKNWDTVGRAEANR